MKSSSIDAPILDPRPRRPAALRVTDITAGHGDHGGCRDITFEVSDGERFVIVGPSGAGKTTLLRAIAGLIPTVGGTVEIAGHDRTNLAPERRDAVYLHQTPLLFPHLNVFENVAFPLRVRGVAADEIRARVSAVLDSVQLDGFMTRRPHTLSGGQRHRAALARAIVAHPGVLLLDEPLSSLDPALRADIRQTILGVAREYQLALVIVTHDLDDAALMADRIGVLLDGRMAQIAPPAELFAHPESLAIARLLAIPNEVAGHVDDGCMLTSPMGKVPLKAKTACGDAIMAFRPDAIQLLAATAPTAQCTGVVVELRYRPQQTTVLIRIESQAAPITIEAAIVTMPSLTVGMVVGLRLDMDRVSVFPVLQPDSSEALRSIASQTSALSPAGAS